MSGLTQSQLDLKEDVVKNLLDEPVQKYLKTATINEMMTRSYNLIFHQIDINAGNQIAVKDAIYAISAWYCFGTYGQSVSNSLQLQDVGAFRANLMHYKEVAQQFASLIGINLDKSNIPPVDDPIAVIDTGRSLLNEQDVSG